MIDQNKDYTIKERSATEVTVQVTVAAPIVQNGIDAVYRRYGRETRIPGFRKGRAPRAFLDARFGHGLFLEEARKALAEEHLPQALAALSLHPVSPPAVNEVSFDETGPFVFEASFSVLPEVELPDYRGIELAVAPIPEVTDEDVKAALEDIRQRFGTLSAKQGEVVNDGDIVRVKEGEKEGDLRAEAGHPVTAALIGRRVGQSVEISLDQPEGKHSPVTLTILGLKEVLLPAIDDELAKDAGYESLSALKEEIRRKLEEARGKKQERTAKLALLDRLVDRLDLPLPEALVERVTARELERLKERLGHPRSSLSFEEYLQRQKKGEEEVRTDYRRLVTRRLRRELVLERLAEKEGIAIDDAELEQMARAQAEEEGENPLRFLARLRAEDRLEDYRAEKVHERVLDLLYEAARIKKEEGCEGKSPS